MSTDIKTGQIWAWNEPEEWSHDEFVIVDPRDGRTSYTYPEDEDGFVWFIREELLRKKAHPVGERSELATSAAIDPTAVKEGDTVTLERPKRNDRVEARVEEVTQPGVLLLEGWGAVFQIGTVDPAWTLTDHQPAPKPEWKSGTSGTATVRGVEGVRVMRRLVENTGRDWTSDRYIGGWLSHNDADVTDFVPDETRPLPNQSQVEQAVSVTLYRTPYAEMGWGPYSGRWATDAFACDDLASRLAPSIMALLRGESR